MIGKRGFNCKFPIRILIFDEESQVPVIPIRIFPVNDNSVFGVFSVCK